MDLIWHLEGEINT